VEVVPPTEQSQHTVPSKGEIKCVPPINSSTYLRQKATTVSHRAETKHQNRMSTTTTTTTTTECQHKQSFHARNQKKRKQTPYRGMPSDASRGACGNHQGAAPTYGSNQKHPWSRERQAPRRKKKKKQKARARKRKKYGQEKGIEGTNPRTVGSEQRKDAQTPSTTPGCIGAPRGCRRAQAAPPDAGGTHTTH